MSDSRLPKKFYKYFWDINPQKLDVAKTARYTAERLLEFGDTQALAWLKKAYGLKNLKTIIKQSRRLTPKSANFYRLLFSIPKKEIKCLQQGFLNKHKTIWPF